MGRLYDHFLIPVCLGLWIIACVHEQDKQFLVTVRGEVPAEELGKTLTHEHILVDFIGADSTGYHRWDRHEVVRNILPYLHEIRERGYHTLMECTPAFLGRDPVLLRMLSDSSGLNILTNTGYYGARNNQYLPDHAFGESAQELSRRWIEEWHHGIGGTGIRPGFIKIGVDADSLTVLHGKLVRAAALTHLETGMTIASHTGPADIAFKEIEILREEGVSPEAFIWVHAQREKDFDKYKEAVHRGAWVSLDGVSENNIGDYLERLVYLNSHNLLDRVLISHDAGWYRPGEANGGRFRPYTAIQDLLVPALLQAGFTPAQVNVLLIDNPAKAFSISKKQLL